MFGDLRIDELLAECLERGECAGLVGLHEPAVSNHVGGEDRRKPSLDTFFGHEWPFRRVPPTETRMPRHRKSIAHHCPQWVKEPVRLRQNECLRFRAESGPPIRAFVSERPSLASDDNGTAPRIRRRAVWLPYFAIHSCQAFSISVRCPFSTWTSMLSMAFQLAG